MISDITPKRRHHFPARSLSPPARAVRQDIYRVRRASAATLSEPKVKVSEVMPTTSPIENPDRTERDVVKPQLPIEDETDPPKTVPKRRSTKKRLSVSKKKSSKTKKSKEKKKKISFKSVAAIVLVFGLLGFSSYVSIDAWLTNQELKDRMAAMPAVASSEIATPEERQEAEGTDEQEPSQDSIANYVVADDMPRTISIPRIGVYAKVLQMGINPDGSMQAPLNIHDAGWYNGSAKPGSEGAAVIDAHASGLTMEGLFGKLKTLENGDVIEIELGSGEKLSYKVIAKETQPIDKVDMRKLMTVQGNTKEGLNLITCDGPWINDRDTMADRVMVYTERI